ncbi:Major facilitator, sugar transporter-like [Parasponia andersonii]|uniref:Major facilitator, sugar transporter-like n=1 Tax=Parasponia andersonii TaxID=3476 RepID=A0A2P5AY84_PARAD|nr:Major facilitator, sugar transporter-like [Parasponia andersonii]
MTLMLIVLCFVASGLSFSKDPTFIMATLCFFRLWLGFGIGGDYPLLTTIISKYPKKKTRGAFIAAMQSFRILAIGMVAKFHVPAYKINAFALIVPESDYVWQKILMFGALSAILTYYWHIGMPETIWYTTLVAKNAKQSASNMSKFLKVEVAADLEKVEEFDQIKDVSSPPWLTFAWNNKYLVSIGRSFQQPILFQKDIFIAIGWIPKAKTMSALEELFSIAKAQTLIAICSIVPMFMLILAIPYHHWALKDNRIGFLVMYSLTSSSPTSAPMPRHSSSQPRFFGEAAVHLSRHIGCGGKS